MTFQRVDLPVPGKNKGLWPKGYQSSNPRDSAVRAVFPIIGNNKGLWLTQPERQHEKTTWCKQMVKIKSPAEEILDRRFLYARYSIRLDDPYLNPGGQTVKLPTFGSTTLKKVFPGTPSWHPAGHIPLLLPGTGNTALRKVMTLLLYKSYHMSCGCICQHNADKPYLKYYNTISRM